MPVREPKVEGEWLAGFTRPVPIRASGAFHLYACHRDGAPALVVVGAPSADRIRVAGCLDRLSAAHASPELPGVPRLLERGESSGVPFVALDCDGEVDLDQVFERILEGPSRRLPYPAAIAFSAAVGGAIAAAHEAGHTLGGLSLRNLVSGPSGRLWLIGLGHNVVLRREDGQLLGVPDARVAPEIVAGAAPSPGSDLWSFATLLQGLMPLIEPPAALERLYQGRLEPADLPLLSAMQWFQTNVFGALPGQRTVGLREALDTYARVWQVLGATPDPAALTAFLATYARPAEPVPAPAGEAAPGALVVASDLCWYQTPAGERFTLERRGALRRLVTALVEESARAPGRALPLAELLEAGWPGERPIPEAGANRVYVALSTLRKMGLREVVVRTEEGWLIDPAVPVVRTADA